MAQRVVMGAASAAAVLVIIAAVLVLSARNDGASDPAAEAVGGLAKVTSFSIHAARDGCTFDQARGGLVYRGLTVASTSNGVLDLSFYVQRGSLDDVLPGYVSTVLTFGRHARSHTFDLVIPVTRAQYDAGYDECQYSAGTR
ncbi:hypothetical protein [Nocardioides terrisoli]|uniref:hypothetical protein n=1 Tax=Nocardioides terrisoli TaxID=3388267 RepID=UPI00287BBFEF|nr:hypothetical protein [Nocardioides marmorisolisilvae]